MSANLAVFLKYGVNLEIIASPHGEAMIFIDSVQNHHKNLECKKKEAYNEGVFRNRKGGTL